MMITMERRTTKVDDERNLVTARVTGFDKIRGYERSMALLNDKYGDYNDGNGSDFLVTCNIVCLHATDNDELYKSNIVE